MDNNMKNKDFKNIFLGLWIASLIFYVIYFFNTSFAQTVNQIDLDPGEISISLVSCFFRVAMLFDNIFYYAESSNSVLWLSMQQIFMCYIAFAIIVVASCKPMFFNSKHKLSRSIQYLLISLSMLVLGVIVYFQGTLVRVLDQYNDTYVYEFQHQFIPAWIGVALVGIDIVYLIYGIKEYKINKKNKENIRLSFKDKIKFYFSDIQNILLTVLVFFSVFLFLNYYFSIDGYEFVKIKKTFIN